MPLLKISRNGVEACLQFFTSLSEDVMPRNFWQLFVGSFAVAFIAYWLHLGRGLDEWLGVTGFHLVSPTSSLFPALPSFVPFALWCITLMSASLLFIPRLVAIGSFLAGCGLGYATMCDPASTGALNMHFLFGFAVIFWAYFLQNRISAAMIASPAYVLRLYLVVVYFGSGWRKAIYGDWLINPNALLHCLTGFYTTDLTRLLFPLVPFWAWTGMQYAAVGFELLAPLLLLYLPFRKTGIVCGCLLHLGIALLMKDLIFFSFQMLTFYIPLLIPTQSPPAFLAPSKSVHQSVM